MPLNTKEAAKLVRTVRRSNADYFVRTFRLSQTDADFLLNAWRTYVKGHPNVIKGSPLQLLDSFIHGYLAHVEFIRVASQALPYVNALGSRKKGQSQAVDL